MHCDGSKTLSKMFRVFNFYLYRLMYFLRCFGLSGFREWGWIWHYHGLVLDLALALAFGIGIGISHTRKSEASKQLLKPFSFFLSFFLTLPFTSVGSEIPTECGEWGVWGSWSFMGHIFSQPSIMTICKAQSCWVS